MSLVTLNAGARGAPQMRIASFAWAVVVSMALAVGFAPRSFAQEDYSSR